MVQQPEHLLDKYDVMGGSDAMLAKLAKIGQRRGPMHGEGRGAGHPWWGIVEETPCIWVGWITEAARRLGVPVPKAIEVGEVRVPLVWVQMTFGKRYYFKAPCCGRRVEAVYVHGRAVGCRKCLHLGYRSQAYRLGSLWGYLDLIFDRHSLWGRWELPDNAVGHDLVQPLRELLAAGIEDLLARVKIEEDENDTD